MSESDSANDEQTRAGAKPRVTPQENEAKILHFKREQLTDGVHVARVALRKGESSLLHKHSITRDTFFVMSGVLTLTIYTDGAQALPAYHSITVDVAEVRTESNGRTVHRLRVRVGEVLQIEPGVTHCAANLDDAPCEFLCIEGVGAYDFVQVAES